ncbi:uncharacterized protein LOC120653649 [Panicum virgatum]|uniref:uncharacterized protein LOC120653649 n=1 Tax=Panicum virgatum TaxID=38727 RepID=UPI0019D5CE70|nr:uncharacterized protein LOC120653649 [Panicum virgatum]
MAGYLEALNPLAWENARAKNALFDAIGEEIFARVHSKKTAHEVWEELETIHVGSKKLREEKYQVLKEKLNEFKIHPSELLEQIYTRLNVLIEDINALEISPLSTSDIIRKIFHSLHKPKYNIVTSLVYEKDLSTLQVNEVVGKIRSHEIFLLGEIDPPQAKGDLALKAKGENKSKKKSKGKTPMSSSSEASDDSSDEEGDEDTKLALLMRKTTKLMSRLNKKGYNFDPKKNKFRIRKPKNALKKICYVCGNYGHLSYDCPQESNKKQDEDNQPRHNKDHDHKKDHDKKEYKKKRSFKKKEQIKAFLGEWVIDSETSIDDDDDDDDDDTPRTSLWGSPSMKMNHRYLHHPYLKLLLDEYNDIIKKLKSKLKCLKNVHVELKTSHDELLVRHNEVEETHEKCVVSSKQLREDHGKVLVKHNELVEKHDEVVVLNKSLEESNKKLKLDYANLNSKYQELEFAFDAIDDELETLKTKNINASTYCETNMETSNSFTNHDVPSSSKTNHDREKKLEEELQKDKSKTVKIFKIFIKQAQNKFESSVVKFLKKTPYELLVGRKPNISYFRVFGCKCYIFKKRKHLGKFESRYDVGFLVGYSSNSKAYRVFNNASRMIEETYDVEFDETNGSKGKFFACDDVSDEPLQEVMKIIAIGQVKPKKEDEEIITPSTQDGAPSKDDSKEEASPTIHHDESSDEKDEAP